MAFLATLEKLGPERAHLHFDDEANGKFLDLAGAIATGAGERTLLLLRPQSDVAAFEAAAASRPHHNVHVEYFTPEAEAATTGGFWVELAQAPARNISFRRARNSGMLYEAGVDVDYSCELGICGECVTRVISGIPEHRNSVLSEEEQAANDKVMICCCGSKSERLVLDM